MKEKNDENRTSVICDERENRSAIKVAPVAAAVRNTRISVRNEWSRPTENREDIPNGCTARPRVEPDPIVTLLEADMICVE